MVAEDATGPIQYFFENLASEARAQHPEAIGEGTKFTLTEGGRADVEFKGADWVLGENIDISEKILDEFDKGARVILIGYDEASNKIKAVPESRFNHDRFDYIEQSIRNQLSKADAKLVPVPVEGGDYIVSAIRL